MPDIRDCIAAGVGEGDVSQETLDRFDDLAGNFQNGGKLSSSARLARCGRRTGLEDELRRAADRRKRAKIIQAL